MVDYAPNGNPLTGEESFLILQGDKYQRRYDARYFYTVQNQTNASPAR